MTDNATVRWGIISTGAIASCFRDALHHTHLGECVAVASRDLAKAQAFASQASPSCTAYGSYEDLLDDPQIDAVYLATPHPHHAVWSIRALEAGKHVLCEKPTALNLGQAESIMEAAHRSGKLFAEAFMYRCHPQTTKLVELLQEGCIGEVRHVEASFGYDVGDAPDPAGRHLNPELGGGAIMDVGCYPVSLIRLVSRAMTPGAHEAPHLAEPLSVKGTARLGTTGVDEVAVASFGFASGMIGVAQTGIRATLRNDAVIVGSAGTIRLPNPWQASRGDGQPGIIELTRDGETERLEIPSQVNSFTHEIERFAETIASGKRDLAFPAMGHADTLGNMKALDQWRRQVRLAYPQESPAWKPKLTVAERVLKKRDDSAMVYGSVPGLEMPISKMVMGCDNQGSYAAGAAIWDDWIERGGNAFDTAWMYHDGHIEKLLGQWIESRGIRHEIALICKGAHTPRCLPHLIAADFQESLGRLRTDAVDIYFFHRDNLDVPVGELLDPILEQVQAGRIKAYGGSNWSTPRIDAAIDYARSKGLPAMQVVSNNLSLAEMVKPVWDGCIHLSDDSGRLWLQQRGLVHFAWSSQARGYFLPESLRLRLGQSSFEAYDSPGNQARRARAEQLADAKGVSPMNIAAAYVLHQPFESFALIGPRALAETRTALSALDVELTATQVDWLWSGEGDPGI